jgi:hypothetical protein
MPFGSTTDKDVRSAELNREDLDEAAREPLEDHSGSAWGAWGQPQIAQPDEEKSVLDVLDVAGEEQREAHRGSAQSIPPEPVPSPLLNPTAHDIRKDTYDTDEARMATEPPRR